MVIGVIAAVAGIAGAAASYKGAKASAEYQRQVAINNAKAAERQAAEERINAEIERENAKRILGDIDYFKELQDERAFDFIEAAYTQIDDAFDRVREDYDVIAGNQVRRSGSGLDIRSRSFELQREHNKDKVYKKIDRIDRAYERVDEGLDRITRDTRKGIQNIKDQARNHTLKAEAHSRRATDFDEHGAAAFQQAQSAYQIGRYGAIGAAAEGIIAVTSILGSLSANPYNNQSGRLI